MPGARGRSPSPEGTVELVAAITRSAVPAGLDYRTVVFPALKRRAILVMSLSGQRSIGGKDAGRSTGESEELTR
jgi:hypothetical protein